MSRYYVSDIIKVREQMEDVERELDYPDTYSIRLGKAASKLHDLASKSFIPEELRERALKLANKGMNRALTM